MTDATAPALSRGDHRNVWMLSFGHGATHWVLGTLYIINPEIQRALGLSYSEIGALMTIYYIGSFGANLVSGAVVDMTGRRVLMQVAMLLMIVVGAFFVGLSEHYLLICAMYALLAFAIQSWHPAAISWLSTRYAKNRGYVISIHMLGAHMGDSAAPLICAALITWIGWEHTTMLSGLPCLFMALVIAVVLLPSEKAARAGGDGGMSFAQYLGGLRMVLSDRTVLLLGAMAGFRAMVQNGLLWVLPLYIQNDLQKSTLYSGTAITVLQLGGFIAAPLAGHLSDKHGRWKVTFYSMIVVVAVMAGLFFVTDPLIFVACVSFVGFGVFAMRPVLQSWMMDSVPSNMTGSGTSLIFASQAVLSAAAPLIGGIIADIHGLIAVFYMLGAVAIIGNLICIVLPRDEPPAKAA